MLKRTQDRKTANSVMPNGKASRIANAFSLPAGRDYSCAGATEFCNSICYAGKLEKIYKGFRGVVLHNWELVKDASYGELCDMLGDMIVAFEKECDMRGAKKVFRIHADGDFFNKEYILAWQYVIVTNPNIHFWAYTRVLDAIKILNDIPNLSLYFSADPDNAHLIQTARDFGVKIATVARTFDAAKEIAGKGTKCPEQIGAIPLISEKGGACVACGMCVNGRRDVLFSVTKK